MGTAASIISRFFFFWEGGAREVVVRFLSRAHNPVCVKTFSRIVSVCIEFIISDFPFLRFAPPLYRSPVHYIVGTLPCPYVHTLSVAISSRSIRE